MDILFVPTEGHISTVIEPNEISNNINQILLTKIKRDIEGKCTNIGYIQKNSLKILQKSLGSHLSGHFNGNIIYSIKYVANICNPVTDMKIKCKIININKMGILAQGGDDSPPPLSILLARQHHIENEYFNELKVGDEIIISVLGKRFEYGDNQISIIGKLEDNNDELFNLEDNKSEDSSEQNIDLVKDIEVSKETKKSSSKKKTKLKIKDDNIIHYFNRTKLYKQFTPSFNENEFVYKERRFPSIEHAYQSEKNENESYKDLFTIGSDTYIGKNISQARKAGSNTNLKKLKLKIIDSWDIVKNQVMEDITREYLKINVKIKELLKNTDNKILIFKGIGVDEYWGVNNLGEGENNHGKILMKIRQEL